MKEAEEPATDPDLETIRAALKERIGEIGLRGTAREIGMSATGLRDVVDGVSRPYSLTWGRLVEWYVDLQDNPPPPGRREVRRALLSITRHLPRDERHQLIGQMEEMLWTATQGIFRITRPGGGMSSRYE